MDPDLEGSMFDHEVGSRYNAMGLRVVCPGELSSIPPSSLESESSRPTAVYALPHTSSARRRDALDADAVVATWGVRAQSNTSNLGEDERGQ